ncbi:MAG TPA: DUF559 domain-containing protein [Anaerolineales bacterium]
MHRAGELRQEMTPAEKRLWEALRGNQLQGVSFRRSHAIGRHIADFCSPRLKLIVELDGNPHHTRQEADAERTQYLEALGYRVLRFWNSRVIEDLSGVLREIEEAIQKSR